MQLNLTPFKRKSVFLIFINPILFCELAILISMPRSVNLDALSCTMGEIIFNPKGFFIKMY